MTVYVADEQPLYREGIAATLLARGGLSVVGMAEDGATARAEILAKLPDVGVLSTELPGLSGIQVARHLRDAGCPTRLILLADDRDCARVFEGLAAGADAYMAKTVECDPLSEAIEAVARGQNMIGLESQRALVADIHARGRRDRPELTQREVEVLRLMADGGSAPEIGRALYLSTATVKSHCQNIYVKLGVSDRAAAVAQAIRTGIVE